MGRWSGKGGMKGGGGCRGSEGGVRGGGVGVVGIGGYRQLSSKLLSYADRGISRPLSPSFSG